MVPKILKVLDGFSDSSCYKTFKSRSVTERDQRKEETTPRNSITIGWNRQEMAG